MLRHGTEGEPFRIQSFYKSLTNLKPMNEVPKSPAYGNAARESQVTVTSTIFGTETVSKQVHSHSQDCFYLWKCSPRFRS